MRASLCSCSGIPLGKRQTATSRTMQAIRRAAASARREAHEDQRPAAGDGAQVPWPPALRQQLLRVRDHGGGGGSATRAPQDVRQLFLGYLLPHVEKLTEET
eukprot:6300663-Prymnesium_polylepis.1